jgi:hypothetical protein
MIIILCITLGISIVSCAISILGFVTFLNFFKGYKQDIPQRTILKMEDDDLITDSVELALQYGLECMVMPDVQDRPTLFVRGKDDQVMPVCIIPQVKEKRKSPEYNFVLDQIKKEISQFVIDNKENLEQDNVKN